ncbi:hypothetical protein MSPP1_001838 [Malassezia sp. CBS 17886]|nr:hypothetical protein MSPP1_001838 [Malassezia sp. CBS 17886]
MKYLEYPELEVLSRALTFELAECKVFTRLEAYSCKAVNKEKRLFKTLESSYLLSASNSPPAYLDEALASPFGRLDQPSARKTLFLLIATLNGAFPDHDFSDVSPTEFSRESSPTMVLTSLTSTLLSLRSGTGSPHSADAVSNTLEENSVLGSLARGGSGGGGPAPGFGASAGAARPAGTSLFAVLDEIVNIADCEVYTFHPDTDSDPHACAEPDEEGGDMDVGDPYDEGDMVDDDSGVASAGSVAAERTDAGAVAGMDEDQPMFDEEVYSGGFESGGLARSAPAAPLAYMGLVAGSRAPRPGTTPRSSSRGVSQGVESPTLVFDEDDLGGAGAGLLWSTFAFFYNRRMKRILFVSVWSRRNTPPGQAPVVWNSPSLGPVPNPAGVHVAAAERPDALHLAPPRTALRDEPSERPGEYMLTPTPSPTKAAMRLRPLPPDVPRRMRSSGLDMGSGAALHPASPRRTTGSRQRQRTTALVWGLPLQRLRLGYTVRSLAPHSTLLRSTLRL